jgi:hypothetical protein
VNDALAIVRRGEDSVGETDEIGHQSGCGLPVYMGSAP